MIRIIVPTMWNYMPFWDFAADVLRLEVVNEFVIINNAPNKTPELELLTHPKVKVITFGKNIFVNPSWNVGAWNSLSDILCIVNDDFLFDIRLLYKIDKFVTSKIGCVGLSEQQAENGKVPMLSGDINFIPYTNQSRWGVGVLFFMHRDNWIDIPSELLVCYGDNFVFDQCLYRGLQNYMITELFHYHAGAKTTTIITDNGRKDDLYINREAEIYNSSILPNLMRQKI